MTTTGTDELNDLRQALRSLGHAKLKLKEELQTLTIEYSELEDVHIQCMQQIENNLAATNNTVDGISSITHNIYDGVSSITNVLNSMSQGKNSAIEACEHKIEALKSQLIKRDLEAARHEEKGRYLEQILEGKIREVDRLNQVIREIECGAMNSLDHRAFRLPSTECSSFSSQQNTVQKTTLICFFKRSLNKLRLRFNPPTLISEAFNIRSVGDLVSYVLVRTSQGKSLKSIAHSLRKAAREKLTLDTNLAVAIGEIATTLHKDSEVSMWWASLLYDAGEITNASEALMLIPENKVLSKKQQRKIYSINEALQYKDLHLPFNKQSRQRQVSERRLVYVVARVIKERQTGYTIRTHELLKAYKQNGWAVLCVNLADQEEVAQTDFNTNKKESALVDGIEYLTLCAPQCTPNKLSLHHFIEPKVQLLRSCIQEFRTELVVAASNYENALPALVASRMEGCRFVYEVRGLWEYTRSSKLKGWENSEHFKIMAEAERFVAQHSDAVLAQTHGIEKELVARGVDSELIELLPNGVSVRDSPPDEVQVKPTPFNKSHFVLGYIGSIVEYEGIELIIYALARLLNTNSNLRLLIVGDGASLGKLKQIANNLNVQEFVYFVGQVNADSIGRWYDQIDLIVNPRLDRSVTRLVAPLKPLESMLHNTPVLVSNVTAMCDLVEDGQTGFVFESENVEALMGKIQYVMSRLDKVEQVVLNAFNYVSKKCTWTNRLHKVEPVLIGTYNKRFSEFIESLKTEKSVNQQVKERTKALCDEISSPNDVALFETSLKYDQERLPTSIISYVKCRLAMRCLDIGCNDLGWKIIIKLSQTTRSKMVLRTAIKIAYELANFDEAKSFIGEFEGMLPLSASDLKLLDTIKSINKLIDLLSTPFELDRKFESDLSVFYSLAFSLPHSSVGYSTRSHGIILGMQNKAVHVSPYTRPGFPDNKSAEECSQTDIVDGVHYHRCLNIKRAGMDEIDYIIESAEYWTKVIGKGNCSLVQSGSNYVTALPALIAARRNNLPFVYEVRGFWEITRSSRDKSFENTRKYRHMMFFENLVAKQANAVIGITTAMKHRLVKQGVESEKISIAYNGVDSSRFVPREPSVELKIQLGIEEDCPIIGYIGSIVDYEGLDDLLSAAKNLVEKGYKFKLLIVGDGAELEGLKAYADDLNLGEYAIFTGRVPHQLVGEYYSIIDIAPFPRKPWEVCELVSPLKPFEAMAMEKAVVVSDTEALAEIVTNNVNGLTFKKGEINSLTGALEKLLSDDELVKSLGKSSRVWVSNNRSWDDTAQACIDAYKTI